MSQAEKAELWSGKALVTGGAHRIGRAIALGLAEAGADVVIDYHTSADDAFRTAGDIRALGRRGAAVQADVTNAADRDRLIERAASELGGLDILVNSASLFERKAVEDITEADWDRVMAVNAKAPFFLSQRAAPLLRERGGLIVNIVDLSAMQPWSTYPHHAISKAALLHQTRVLARALGPSIRVNAIAPGTVLPPDDHDGHDSAGGPERRIVERNGTPQDVVNALLYLVRSDFVTGEVLIVDGGRMLL